MLEIGRSQALHLRLLAQLVVHVFEVVDLRDEEERRSCVLADEGGYGEI